ncbi:MAG TPA: hypothetical protein VJV79_18135 [Polyangiaceae bacterium]|nr:hypothetical protein [Polyangiaceae bacterium]
MSYRPAGHETMTAISEELVFRGKPRLKTDDDGPEVSVVEGPAGRETLALIADLARPARATQSTLDYGDRISNAPGSKTPSRAPAAPKRPSPVGTLMIFEMLTFVVQAADVTSLASETQRRRFVEEHLLQRLPARNMSEVDRIDVTPWTVQDTVVVRVWCKV